MSRNVSIEYRPSEEDVMYILTRLRSCDRHEIVSVGCTVGDAARLCMSSYDCHLLRYRDEPVFVFGSVPSYPHIRHLFGFGTDRTWRVMPAATQAGEAWKRRNFDDGVLRVEVRVPVSCNHSIKWLSRLGMKPECTLPHVSITGERYVQLAYTKDDFDVHERAKPALVP